jgi:hypothetical protein
VALAKSISNRTTGYIEEMHFGNGGTTVDATGTITYLTPNSSGDNANLYNKTYSKSINDTSSLNLDASRNKITTAHTNGTTYTWEGSAGEGNLLTHVIFHPVQKSLNRLIQIDYTIRIQSLTNFVDV